jgi:hypothetical protein
MTLDILGREAADLIQAAQGDLCFTVVDALPSGAVEVPAAPEGLILGHSETGHHHVARGEARMYQDDADPLVCYLVADGWAEVLHLRAWDTHAPYRVRPGTVVEVRRQRELHQLPDGRAERQVQD